MRSQTGMMLAAPLLAAETKPLTGAELQKEAVSISKVSAVQFRPNLTLYDSDRCHRQTELKGRHLTKKLRAGRDPASRLFGFHWVARSAQQIPLHEPDMNAGTAALGCALVRSAPAGSSSPARTAGRVPRPTGPETPRPSSEFKRQRSTDPAFRRIHRQFKTSP